MIVHKLLVFWKLFFYHSFCSFRYKIGLKIDRLEEWDADADHELVVIVGPAEAATQKRDKIEIALKPSER